LFRYWSGLYERGRTKLIVSNGVGNWFPLRVNAPAEMVHLTLGARDRLKLRSVTERARRSRPFLNETRGGSALAKPLA